MGNTYNLYIDESCHLEHDDQTVMCIGYIKIKQNNYHKFKDQIKKIKLKYKSPTEIKWNKLSSSRLPLYKNLVDYFFNNDIDFRCILVKNKKNLNHEKFNRGDHNAFYYKLIYLLLNNQNTIPPDSNYRVILDIKDTRGKERLNKLEESLMYKNHGDSPFIHFQNIRSHENELLQFTDLFIGAITYKARGQHLQNNCSEAKCSIVKYLEEKSGYSLDNGTEPWEQKFNIFNFQISSSK